MLQEITQLKLKKEKKFVVEMLQIDQLNKVFFVVVFYNRVNKNKESFQYDSFNIAENFFNQLAS